jgi:hypothetical protein
MTLWKPKIHLHYNETQSLRTVLSKLNFMRLLRFHNIHTIKKKIYVRSVSCYHVVSNSPFTRSYIVRNLKASSNKQRINQSGFRHFVQTRNFVGEYSFPHTWTAEPVKILSHAMADSFPASYQKVIFAQVTNL